MTTKSVILIDFDNLFLTLWQLDRETARRFASDPFRWMAQLAESHLALDRRRWLVARCYLNPSGWVQLPEAGERLYFSRFRPDLVRAGFEVIDCPPMTYTGKNAADIRIVIDALDLLGSPCGYEEFVIGSGDSDFAPLLHRLRAQDRRITIISPGYASPAYTSLADRIIGFEGIESILWPEPEQPTESVAPTDATHDAFAAFIRNRYDESTEPLNLSTLSQEALRVVSGARDSDWFGAGSFTRAVRLLNLPNVRLSQHLLWDEVRHAAPPSSESPVGDGSIPEPVMTLVRLLDLPRLRQEDWQPLFAILARYAAEFSFNLTESTRWSRDMLAEDGISVPRMAVSFVVRGAQFGGAPLDSATPPTAKQIGEAFRDGLIERANAAGIVLDAAAERVISAWFGLSQPAPAPQGNDAAG